MAIGLDTGLKKAAFQYTGIGMLYSAAAQAASAVQMSVASYRGEKLGEKEKQEAIQSLKQGVPVVNVWYK